MDISDLAEAVDHSDTKILRRLVRNWAGLAVLAQEGGEIIEVSNAWREIGIPPAELLGQGWKKFVWDPDLSDTETTALASSGSNAQVVKKFRNHYLSDSGQLSLLEWDGTPFNEWNGLTVSIARVVRSYSVDDWEAEYAQRVLRVRRDAQNVIQARESLKWQKVFREGSSLVMQWAATLEGHVLYSDGGGHPEGSFVGKRMGQDFGKNPEFFEAVDYLRKPGSPDTLIQFSVGKEDNPDFSGRRYVNVYTLVRKASGRPYAVAVKTIDITYAVVESGHCPFSNRSCPHSGKAESS